MINMNHTGNCEFPARTKRKNLSLRTADEELALGRIELFLFYKRNLVLKGLWTNETVSYIYFQQVVQKKGVFDVQLL